MEVNLHRWASLAREVKRLFFVKQLPLMETRSIHMYLINVLLEIRFKGFGKSIWKPDRKWRVVLCYTSSGPPALCKAAPVSKFQDKTVSICAVKTPSTLSLESRIYSQLRLCHLTTGDSRQKEIWVLEYLESLVSGFESSDLGFFQDLQSCKFIMKQKNQHKKSA